MYPGSSPKFLESFVHLCFIMRNSFLFDLAGPESLNKFCFLACTWCETLPRTPHRLSVLSHSSVRVSSLLSCHCALCLMLCKLLLLGYFPCPAALASTIYSAIHLPFSDVLLPVFWGSGEGRAHLKALKVACKLSRRATNEQPPAQVFNFFVRILRGWQIFCSADCEKSIDWWLFNMATASATNVNTFRSSLSLRNLIHPLDWQSTGSASSPALSSGLHAIYLWFSTLVLPNVWLIFIVSGSSPLGDASSFLASALPACRTSFLRYNFWTDKFPTPNFSSQVATFNCSKKYFPKNQTRRRPNNKNVANCCILWCCSKVTNYASTWEEFRTQGPNDLFFLFNVVSWSLVVNFQYLPGWSFDAW